MGTRGANNEEVGEGEEARSEIRFEIGDKARIFEKSCRDEIA